MRAQSVMTLTSFSILARTRCKVCSLVAAFEEEFDIEMEEDEALGVQTVADAANFISGYLNK